MRKIMLVLEFASISTQKRKRSLTIPPDPASCKQAIIRVHYQCYYWVQCLQPVIKELPLESHGWSYDTKSGIATPILFDDPQMPPSISKSTRYRRKEDGYEADNDDKKDDAQPPKKLRKGARKGYSSAMQNSKQDSDHNITIEGYSRQLGRTNCIRKSV